MNLLQLNQSHLRLRNNGDGTIMTKENNWVELCQLSEIPERGCRVVVTDKIKIAIFRTHTDDVYAIEDKCPHLGGALSEGIVHGAQVTCPLHNLVINLVNGEALGPEPMCVKSFDVKKEDGKVYLDLVPVKKEAA